MFKTDIFSSLIVMINKVNKLGCFKKMNKTECHSNKIIHYSLKGLMPTERKKDRFHFGRQ